MFGGFIAQGLEKFGQGASTAGKFWGQVQTDSTVGDTLESADKIVGQFKTLRGADALNAQASTVQQLDDLFKSARDNLATPEQQLQFDQQTRMFKARFLDGQIETHAAQQGQEVAVATNQKNINFWTGQIAANPGDLDKVSIAGNNLRQAVTQLYESKYGLNMPDSLRQAAIDAADTMQAETRVKALAATDPARAQKILDDNRELLASAPNYDSLSRMVKNESDRAQADSVTRQIFQGFATGGQPAPSPAPKATGQFASLESQYGLPSGLLNAVWGVESSHGANQGPSSAGAAGNFQWMPDTAKKYGVQIGNLDSEAQGAAHYFSDLLAQHGGNLDAALKDYGGFVTKDASGYIAKVKAAMSSPTAAANSPVPAAQQPVPGFPTREDLISRIPSDLPDEQYNRVYAQVNRTYNQLVQATSADRAQVTQEYKGGLAMLADGRDFNIPEDRIRRLFPPDAAAEMIGNLQDAKAIGQQVVSVRGMTPDEINTTLANNERVLASSTGEDYVRQRKLSQAFQTAVDQHFRELKADPADYLIRTNPQIVAAQQAAQNEKPDQSALLRGNGQPDATEAYAAKMLAEEERLGVPPDLRNVLTMPAAQGLAQQIMGNPEQAPQTIKQLTQKWGSAWPQVWHDLVTDGKLPAAYQAVGTLDDEGQAGLLARGLAEQGKSGKQLVDLLPPKAKTGSSGIDVTIESSPAVRDFLSSMSKSGSSAGQQSDLLGAIKTLAYANAVYTGKDSAAAAQAAIDAFTSKYDFSLPGSPRVPKNLVAPVSQNASATLEGLTAAGVAVPAIYGQPGMPKSQEYIDLLKASPTWITSPKADALWLMDPQGRIVRTPSGDPITVPFTATAPQTRADIPPMGPQF